MTGALVDNKAAAAQAWDQAAEGWNRHAGVIRDWLLEATAIMLDEARIAPGSRVLDIAAGAGDQTLDIARRVGPDGYVLATDISRRIIALAEANARAAGLPQVQTRVEDMQALGLAGADFDAAVCRLGLMLCPGPLNALLAARKALRPGGRFVAIVFSQPQHNPCLVVMMTTALQHAGLTAGSPFTPGTLMSLGKPRLLEELLGAAGFVDIGIQAVSAPFRLPTSRHYIDFVRSSGSPIMEILAPLSPQAQHEAWDDMASRLEVFSTPAGWQGPNELLVAAASAPGT